MVGVAFKRFEEVGTKDVTCNREFFGVMTANAAVQMGVGVGLHRQLRVGLNDASTIESSNGVPGQRKHGCGWLFPLWLPD